jgi:hypothetical protein
MVARMKAGDIEKLVKLCRKYGVAKLITQGATLQIEMVCSCGDEQTEAVGFRVEQGEDEEEADEG